MKDILSKLQRKGPIQRLYADCVRLSKKIQPRTVFIAMLVVVVMVWSFLLVKIHFAGTDLPYGGNFFYHSDDAGQSNAIYDLQQGHRDGFRVGDDNWFIKYPLYAVTNILPVSPAQKLFANSWVVLVTTAALVMAALYGFSRLLVKDKNKQKLAIVLSGVALAAIPVQAFETIKMSNSRNIELGIFLLLLLALYCYEHRDKWFKTHRALKITGLAALAGVLCADDPLFIYLTLVPFVGLVGVYYFVGKFKLSQALRWLGFAGAVFAATVVIRSVVVALLNLRFYDHHSDIAAFEKVWDNTLNFLGSGIGILGIDIFGREPASASTALVVVMFGVTAAAVAAIIYNFKKTRTFFSAFVATLWVWIPAIGVLTTLRVSGEVSRYLIILPFLVPLGIILAVGAIKMKRQLMLLIGLVGMALLLTLGIKGLTLIRSDARPNDVNYATIDALKSQALTKGYAIYRNAGINTHLSGHELSIYPVVCEKDDTLRIRDLFFDLGSLKISTEQTFYIYEASNFKGRCSPESLVKQFGEPSRKEPLPELGETAQIFIYDYDIMQEMTVRK